MFAAIVYMYHTDTDPKSHRDTGGWEAFLGYTKEEAVKQAMIAVQRWEGQPKFKYDPATLSTKQDGYYGPYQIIVGEMTEEVPRFQFDLKPFTAVGAF